MAQLFMEPDMTLSTGPMGVPPVTSVSRVGEPVMSTAPPTAVSTSPDPVPPLQPGLSKQWVRIVSLLDYLQTYQFWPTVIVLGLVTCLILYSFVPSRGARR